LNNYINRTQMTQAFKAVIFDIGGVLIQSPLQGVRRYEIKLDLPPNYINFAISSQGETFTKIGK